VQGRLLRKEAGGLNLRVLEPGASVTVVAAAEKGQPPREVELRLRIQHVATRAAASLPPVGGS
jgi:hypothetical protein